MHGSAGDRRALEREALRNVIAQWNANRLDIFELSEPNEDLEFHGVMRFYFQDSGQKVATKCIRVASDATVEDVIGTLVEKFRPDMRMLSIPSYALYELHEHYPERKMSPDEKPLLVQLNWHVDDREGRFLLKNVDDKTYSQVNSVGMVDSNASFRRKLSKREKKQLKKQEKLSRMRSENGEADKDGVAEKLYTELPETSFTRSISNPEAVMRRRRQQKLERKLQQFRSKDGGPDTGGTLKIYGEALCKDVPYKTLLLSIRDCAGSVVREMLEKYGLSKTDPSQWCLVQVTQQPGGQETTEYVLDDDECPLSILMNAPGSSSIMFHVRRRPADCAPRKRKKKPGALGTNATNPRDPRGETVPILVELGPDGSAPIPGDTARTLRLNNDVMEVGSANGIALQLYGPHIQPRHCVITNTDGVTSLTPCHADAHTYVNGQRIHQTTILMHGSLVKFGHSNTYRFLDPSQEDRSRHPAAIVDSSRVYDRSPRALSPTEPNRENFETTFDLEGNVETVSTASGAREDNRSLGSSSENRLSGMDRYPRGQDPILPAVLEFPEEPQELFLARVITHLDVTTPTFRLAPAYTLYLCARYRASTHYRPELTPTERAQKLTLLLQHGAKLIRHTVQDRSTESISQAFWLANASELLHFLKSDRHVSAFSIQAQDTLADSVQLAFRNLVACLTDELNSVMSNLMSDASDDHPREIINVLSNAMHLLRKCRVNAALTIQLFSQLFHWISARSLSTIINNAQLCTRGFGAKLFNRLRNLQAWAESQGLELAAECHLAKIVQCAHLLQAAKYTADELAKLSAACFKLNSLQLRALLTQYKGEPGEQVAPPPLLEHAARAAEGVADELARAEGREVKLHEDSAPPLQLLLPDDGFSCDVVQGVPPGLADFLHPLQASGLCRLAAQPTSSGHWTVYMSAPRPPSALSTTQPEVQVIRLHKAGGGMGLSIVAAKGAGQERLGIYIKSVVPGGAADRDGRLAAGDQLLSVDGQSLLGITQEKAAEFLVRTGSVVTLEVAKGGAVYHGLATLLQQPSPTPHRALDLYYGTRGSQDSLYAATAAAAAPPRRIYTPPVSRPKNNVFFNSDDSLYKTEVRRLMIPRIEIECEPEFKLQVTDFSEPSPRDVTPDYYGGKIQRAAAQNVPMAKTARSWRCKTSDYVQQKSFSLDVKDIPFIDVDSCSSDTEAYHLTISGNSKKLRQMSSSLQDLSSSTSSVNSGVHDSNLDLSQIDEPIRHKTWKSPDEIRQGGQHVMDLAKRFEYAFDDGKKNIACAASVPDLNAPAGKIHLGRLRASKSAQELNKKLSDYERESLLQLLQDWSVKGSDGINPDEIDRGGSDSPLLKKFIVGGVGGGVQPRGGGGGGEEEDSHEKQRACELCADLETYTIEVGDSPDRNTDLRGGFEPHVGRHFSVLRPGVKAGEHCAATKSFEGDSRDEQRHPVVTKRSFDLKVHVDANRADVIEEGDSRDDERRSLMKGNLDFEWDSRPPVLRKRSLDLDPKKKNADDVIEGDSRGKWRPRVSTRRSSDSKVHVVVGAGDSHGGGGGTSTSMRRNLNSEAYLKYFASNLKNRRFYSEPDLSPRSRLKLEENNLIYVTKYKSEGNLSAGGGGAADSDVMHACKYRNCIFNAKYFGGGGEAKAPPPRRGILKNWKSEEAPSIVRNDRRRFSETQESEVAFGGNPLVRCGSLERFAAVKPKKFPEGYVVRRRGPNSNGNKVVVLRSRKTWKSCSDLKQQQRQRVVRKCCRNARTTCPVLRGGAGDAKRKTQSCVELKSVAGGSDRSPRRMSERDLPSRVDAERTIPSSKSVPALHHISPGSEQSRGGGGGNAHDVFNPGYSRTSSNNSINTNSATPSAQNGGGGGGSAPTNPHNLRSRSTHNLHQQDAGFYQNLSVYRNKLPSPQQLGDRTSALRSSQNSLQSNVTSTQQQRPSSAYYPNPSVAPPNASGRLPLHQSIPNLKSPQPMQRVVHAEDARSGSYPAVNQHPNYISPPPVVHGAQMYQNQNYMGGRSKENYQYAGGESQNYTNYARAATQHDENKQYLGGGGGVYGPAGAAYQQPLHINANGGQSERIQDPRYNAGLLREDYNRHAAAAAAAAAAAMAGRNEEVMRYSSTTNVRMQEPPQIHQQQQQPGKAQEPPPPDFARNNEMRTSKSEDMLRQFTPGNQGDIFRYASSGNIKAQEQQQQQQQQRRDAYHHHNNKLNSEERKEEAARVGGGNNLRGQAKLAEMGEEVRRRQNRTLPSQFHSPNNSGYYHQQYYGPYPQQQQQQQQQQYGPPPSSHHILMAQNTQSMQNLSLSQQQAYSSQHTQQHNAPPVTSPTSYQQQHYYGNQNVPTSPGYPKSPPIAPKPLKKPDDPPDLPPVNTHPLYSASAQDPPKMSLYSGANVASSAKSTRDPWVREEQERQSEKRREQAMIIREQQIVELSSMPNRSQQQEEHLRVLQLEREFQKRAMEEPEQDDDDDVAEKDSPIPYGAPPTQSASSATPTGAAAKQETPMSILKAGVVGAQAAAVPQQTEPQAPPPPERGSSYAVMSLRNKEGTKRVSFNDSSSAAAAAATAVTPQQQQPPPPGNLSLEEIVREDPNSFIRQAESMLASPTTPTDAAAISTATPGVIGAQEVYRDPRTRRLAEQAQQKSQAPVPEKLSFKEKMKMFAMETGEAGRK